MAVVITLGKHYKVFNNEEHLTNYLDQCHLFFLWPSLAIAKHYIDWEKILSKYVYQNIFYTSETTATVTQQLQHKLIYEENLSTACKLVGGHEVGMRCSLVGNHRIFELIHI